VGLVVAKVPAGTEVHRRWRIDTMWRASSTQRPGRHVMCFVVLIVVALGMLGFWAPRSRAGWFSSTVDDLLRSRIGTRECGVASGPT
jgi:hypothetical protein